MNGKLWLIIILFAFLLGWLFPVEGPIDYVYDNWVDSQPKAAVKNGPAIKPVTEVYIDLDEDNIPEWYWVIKKPEE